MGEVKPIFLCAPATLAMTVLEAELELHTFVCKTREEAKNSAGAEIGEQDFDFAQVGRENLFFSIMLGVSIQWGKAWARL